MGEKSHRVGTENKGTLFGKKTIRAHRKATELDLGWRYLFIINLLILWSNI